MSLLKIAILINPNHRSIQLLAEAEKRGIESAGGTAHLYKIREMTTPFEKNVVKFQGTESLQDIPFVDAPELNGYDAFLFGLTSSCGITIADWRAFWDSTGSLWANSKLVNRPAGMFTSTAMPGSGQDATITSTVTTMSHQGMLFVPLGYKHAPQILNNMEEIHGGSGLGAGTFTGEDGKRAPSALELQLAEIQGTAFVEAISKLNLRKS